MICLLVMGVDSKEKKPTGRYIETVEVNPANSHCNNTEFIATLKGSGLKICLDPHVPWAETLNSKLSRDTFSSLLLEGQERI
ncbi:hypothetical protein LDENG_00114690 [Lucifuga dentata]|nr:hypothetical protein LDENG_00114690 [Lucifuga dentata]